MQNPTKPQPKEPEWNYDLYKEGYIYHKMAVKQMLRALIKKTPKEILLEVLKEEKIIQQDWLAKGNKFKERKDEP